MIAHMTAHFRGGPWAGMSKYRAADKPRNFEVQVQDVLPFYRADGHYQLDAQASMQAFGELLVDVVYEWVDWTAP